MHVSAVTIVAKIKQETANLERALAKGESDGEIREHARLIRAFSELIEEGSGAASGKTERPVAVNRPREEHEGSGQGNLLEF